jgi:hypothetical protein|nr:MAG TPA: hypothetical protein [Caudoviricetes sp.]
MKQRISDFFCWLAAGLVYLLLVGLALAITWAVVTFFVWLICLCFDLPFNLLYATGIWLVIVLIKILFRKARGE